MIRSLSQISPREIFDFNLKDGAWTKPTSAMVRHHDCTVANGLESDDLRLPPELVHVCFCCAGQLCTRSTCALRSGRTKRRIWFRLPNWINACLNPISGK